MMTILSLLCFIILNVSAKHEASASNRNEFEVFENTTQAPSEKFSQMTGLGSYSNTSGCLIIVSKDFCLYIVTGTAPDGPLILRQRGGMMKLRSHAPVTGLSNMVNWSNGYVTGLSDVANWSNGSVAGLSDVANWSNGSVTGLSNVANWSNGSVTGLSDVAYWSNAPVTGLISVVSHRLTETFTASSQQTLMPEFANSDTFEDWTLWNLLASISTTAMKDCVITILYGEEFEGSVFLQGLIRLPNLKEVVKVSGVADFKNMRWMDVSSCRGYIIIQSHRELLLEVTNAEDYDWDYKGRFVLVGFNSEQLQDLFRSRKFYNTQDTIGITKDQRMGEWSLYTNWRVFKGDIALIGSWIIDHFTFPETVLFPDKVNDLHGAPVKQGTFEYKPIVLYARSPNGTVQERYGIDILTAKEAVEALNGTVIYDDIPKKDRWSVLINKITRSEVDIGFCNLYITKQSYDLHRYAFPHFRSVSRVLIRKPRPRPGWERVIYPFHFSTWISVICGIILTGPLLCLFARAGQYTGGEKRDMMSLGFAYLYTAGILFMEGQAILPIRKSLQLFVGFLWIYAMIITTGYCSNLTALLTVSKIPGTIDTFQELHDSQKDIYSYGVPTYIIGFKATGNPYMEGLIERLYPYDDTVPEKILDGSSVFLTNEATLLYQMQTIYTYKGISIVRLMKESFTSFSVALGVPKSSVLRHKLDKVIIGMVEGGLPNLWFKNALRRVLKENTKTTEKSQFQRRLQVAASHALDEGAVKALGVDHVQGFFFILLVGYMVATFAFMAEALQGR